MFYPPFRTNVFLFNRNTGYFSQPNACHNVSKLQTQVLSGDGESGSALPWSGLRKQLYNEENRDISLTGDGGRDLTDHYTTNHIFFLEFVPWRAEEQTKDQKM